MGKHASKLRDETETIHYSNAATENLHNLHCVKPSLRGTQQRATTHNNTHNHRTKPSTAGDGPPPERDGEQHSNHRHHHRHHHRHSRKSISLDPRKVTVEVVRLSSYQEGLVQRFVEVTNEHQIEALLWLEKSDWNLADALNAFLASSRPNTTVGSGPTPPKAFPSKFTVQIFSEQHMRKHSGLELVSFANAETAALEISPLTTSSDNLTGSTTRIKSLKELAMARFGKFEVIKNYYTWERLVSADLREWILAQLQAQPLVLEATTATKVRDLLERIGRRWFVPVQQLRLWDMPQRANGTFRPAQVVNPNKDFWLSVHTLRGEYYCWVEVGRAHIPRELAFVPNTKDNVLLFFKYFDPMKGALKFVCHHSVPKMQPLHRIEHKLRKLMDLPHSQPLLFFEEIKPAMVDPIHVECTPAELELSNGDIIVFQKAEDECKYEYGFVDVVQYVQYLNDRMDLILRPYPGYPCTRVYQLEFTKSMPMELVESQISELLGISLAHNRKHNKQKKTGKEKEYEKNQEIGNESENENENENEIKKEKEEENEQEQEEEEIRLEQPQIQFFDGKLKSVDLDEYKHLGALFESLYAPGNNNNKNNHNHKNNNHTNIKTLPPRRIVLFYGAAH